jgi:hypothetical protein
MSDGEPGRMTDPPLSVPKSDSGIMVMKSAEDGPDMMQPTCWMAR